MVVESIEMALGAIPRPGRVPEQRLLSPEIGLRWRRRYGTFHGWVPWWFRVFALGAIYRRKGKVGRCPRGPHHGQAWPGGATTWCGCLSALLHLFFGLRVRDSKIGTLVFVSSNFENIFCTTFLKYKNSRKQELALWHLVNRLVPQNA
jgi:hypothetical protein